MKFIRLIGNFYHKNIAGSILLLFIVTYSLYIASFNLGIVRYYTYARDSYKNSGLADCEYYMINLPQELRPLEEEYTQEVERIRSEVENLNEVDAILQEIQGSVLFSQNGSADYLAVSRELAEAYRPLLAQGQWLTEDIACPPGAFPIVIAGPEAKNYQVGDIVTASFFDSRLPSGKNIPLENMLTKVDFYVAGLMGEFGEILYFNSSGGHMTTDLFFTKSNTSRGFITILLTPEFEETICRYDRTKFAIPNCFVRLKTGLTAGQREECLAALKEYGSVATSDEIFSNTTAQIRQTLYSVMSFPFFALGVSTFCFFGLAVLFVQKKLDETAVYALCGCSRRKSFAITAAGLTLIGLVACLAVGATIPYLSVTTRQTVDSSEINNFYFDGYSYLYLLGYLAIILIISLTAPLLARRKSSPIELYRRKTQ